MDLWFSKYASPFKFLDLMIENQRLSPYVDALIDIENEKKQWEFFLYKVFDKTYDDFKNTLNVKPKQTFSKRAIVDTIKKSHTVLSEFNPYK